MVGEQVESSRVEGVDDETKSAINETEESGPVGEETPKKSKRGRPKKGDEKIDSNAPRGRHWEVIGTNPKKRQPSVMWQMRSEEYLTEEQAIKKALIDEGRDYDKMMARSKLNDDDQQKLNFTAKLVSV